MCQKHPKYKAINKPKVNCTECWRMFLAKLPPDRLVGRPIRCNRQTLELKHGKTYSEVLYIGDAHLGSPQFDEVRFLSMLDYAKAHSVYVFLMGDLLESATRNSVGAGIYEQKIPLTQQYEQMCQWLQPLASRKLILGTHRGNHEFRAYKESGVDIAKAFAKELNVPYLGDACWNRFTVGNQSYSVYSLHGRTAAIYDGTVLTRLERIATSFNADLVAMGHAHRCVSSSVISQRVIHGQVIEFKKHLLVTGHYLKYDRGYAQTTGMSISKLGSPKVKFFSEKHDLHISW